MYNTSLNTSQAYSIGMQAEVIVDGHPSCMPASVATIADRLSAAGWATSAYGKWDMGMTTWGCTPTCRGFGHFFGFCGSLGRSVPLHSDPLSPA